ncbi:hypothetical protein BJF84_15850 [Rhodococcus sp. CUA-806]|nr:hypothetical protein BJF84_15850 [Rhodococcus sp. CUA-806]
MDEDKDEQQLHYAIADLARAMHHSTSSDPVTDDVVLGDVTAWAVKFLSAVDHAGISLIRRRGSSRRPVVESASPTGEVSELIDCLQGRFGIGPCLDAIGQGSAVLVHDYTTEPRWPQLTAQIVDATPVRSSLSILLYTDDQSIGALNLYANTAGAFDEHTIEQAEPLAAHIAVGISMTRRDEQFRSALASRDIIGQAKGMIMERFDVNALQAFQMLGTLSQERNIPVTTLAAELVDRRRAP